MLDPGKARKCVDKFFTYATPHNGIDVGGFNIPSSLSLFDIDNFDCDKRMPQYLDLVAAHNRHARVDLIPEDRFPSRRIFCMGGTNRMDYDAGRAVDALYQIEMLAPPRGKLWYLSRRTTEEDSVACVAHANWKEMRSMYLSSVFLANSAKVNPRRRSLAYNMTLGIRVPDYEIERRLWVNEHYEGGYLYRNSIVLEMVPPCSAKEQWKVAYAWQDSAADGKPRPTNCGVKGRLRFVISAWNSASG